MQNQAAADSVCGVRQMDGYSDCNVSLAQAMAYIELS